MESLDASRVYSEKGRKGFIADTTTLSMMLTFSIVKEFMTANKSNPSIRINFILASKKLNFTVAT